jgi:CRP/FNR family transcriptional regulator
MTASLHAIKAGCAGGSMHQLCLPIGLSDTDMARLGDVIGRCQRVAAGERLGMDAIGTVHHRCDAVALEGLFGQVPNLMRHFTASWAMRSRASRTSCSCSESCAPRSAWPCS